MNEFVNKSLTVRSLLLISCLLFSVITLSQNADENSNYNTPPGLFINPKFDPNEKDLSGVINELEHKYIAEDQLVVRAKFIKEGLTEQDWSNLERDNPDQFEYYAQAKSYYDNLSLRVKTILCTEDLWHIYMFRQDLKEKLINY